MAASLLNSPRAVNMSIYVVRAFVKMREEISANSAILKRLAEIGCRRDGSSRQKAGLDTGRIGRDETDLPMQMDYSSDFSRIVGIKIYSNR